MWTIAPPLISLIINALVQQNAEYSLLKVRSQGIWGSCQLLAIELFTEVGLKWRTVYGALLCEQIAVSAELSNADQDEHWGD